MKILVIAMSGIGDTLIATPLLHELRANFRDAQIDVLTMWAGAKDLLEGNPHVNRVWQKNMINEGVLKTLPFLWKLRGERYDVSINAHTQGRLAYRAVAAIIRAQRRVGHAYENNGVLDRLWFMHAMVPEDYAVHSIENNNRLLPLIGAKQVLPSHDMELFLTPAEEQFAREFIAANHLASRRVLGVHVGSGGTKNLALKRWPLERYIELFKRLDAARPEIAVLLFGGPEERAAHARIRVEVPGASIFVPETRNLRQAAALMKHCHAFLSVDTALMHVAAVVKVPNQIVIEAMTLNATNVPYGNAFKLVPNPAVNGRNLDYYRYNGKPIQGTDAELIAAMSSVKVETVEQAVTLSLSPQRGEGRGEG
ncbi:MAG TPA: glycosyltransferase family 9 protein [Candidatus Limnocylindria bacterium]|nr:glycosyltransferase family 9 protein [Candidatus Limnocylindria bacterium]